MAFGSHVAGSVPIFIVIVAIAILVCVRAVFFAGCVAWLCSCNCFWDGGADDCNAFLVLGVVLNTRLVAGLEIVAVRIGTTLGAEFIFQEGG